MNQTKGFMDYLPLLNLVLLLVAMIGAFLTLKLSIATFQTAIEGLKEELEKLATEMRVGFAQFGEKLGKMSERIVAIETIQAGFGQHGKQKSS